MKTIKEVSEIFGVSVQTIYKKIDSQLKEELQGHVQEVQRGSIRLKAITDKGVEIIRESFGEVGYKQVNEQVNNENERLIALLEETIEVLKGQLSVKDEQLKDLNDTLKQQQEISRNGQVLLRKEQETKELLEESEALDKVNWFKKWFKGN